MQLHKLNRRDFLKFVAGGPIFLPMIFGGQSTGTRRVGILADTHIPVFPESVEHFWPILKSRPVDCWIIAGDVGHIEAGESGWKLVTKKISELGKPVYCVPGNHDLIYMDNRAPLIQPDGWRQWIGETGFIFETERTKFIGVDSNQWDDKRDLCLVNELATLKRVVLIQHHPLLWGEEIWLDEARNRKLSLLKPGSIIITGHRHHFAIETINRGLHIVVPPISYVYAPEIVVPLRDGLFPMSYPTRGWLELVDDNNVTVEFYNEVGTLGGVFN